MTRTPKTPAQRATEAVDVERRRLIKIGKRIADLRRDLLEAETSGEASAKRLDYLQANPDLPAPANLPPS